MSAAAFPFTAVVGHDQAKLALVLAAREPMLGGVLLRGQKGSAKTTLARGLAAVLPGTAPFVELPIGTTEDRLIGSIDLAAALTGGEVRFAPGLLAAAHGGVLYVDEVNLLADHLVDVLLDAAVSGVNRVEREGVSHVHPSRFVLIGSMNPEEGELRPQLLDRFGLAADVASSVQPGERAEAVRRRLAFDADPELFAAGWKAAQQEASAALVSAPSARVGDELVERVSALCASVGAEGLRADLVIVRAAGALAGLEGRAEATIDDVRRVAPMALAHRRRRNPLDDPGVADDELQSAIDASAPPESREGGDGDEGPSGGHPDDDGSDHDGGGGGTCGQERVDHPRAPRPVVLLEAGRGAGGADGRRSMATSDRGRLIGDRPPQGATLVGGVALAATVRAAAVRRASDVRVGPGAASPVVRVQPGDVREAVREQRTANLVIVAVDASGSMGAERRMEVTKGALLGLLLDAYQRRDRVALVTFGGGGAQVVLRPTGSVEVARSRLSDLATGGRTPLAAGIEAATALAAESQRAGVYRPLLVLVTDGRATAGPPGRDPFGAARAAAEVTARLRIPTVVVDAEEGLPRLGLAAELASAMGARYLTLDGLTASTLRALVVEDSPSR